ncbi:hypothetical protein EG829_04305 [bacterium]|nr:hypothetical protein [bacterium]
MDFHTITAVGLIAGIGGATFGVLLLLFRGVIRNRLFPNLAQRQAALQLRFSIILAGSVAVLGLASWVLIHETNKEELSGSRGREAISLPTFKKEITAAAGIDELERFVDRNRGKAVYIATGIPENLSEIAKTDGRDELMLNSGYACDEKPFGLKCATSHVMIGGTNHTLKRVKGMNRFTGYFVVSETKDFHQGVYYMMESVPRSQALQDSWRK